MVRNGFRKHAQYVQKQCQSIFGFCRLGGCVKRVKFQVKDVRRRAGGMGGLMHSWDRSHVHMTGSSRSYWPRVANVPRLQEAPHPGLQRMWTLCFWKDQVGSDENAGPQNARPKGIKSPPSHSSGIQKSAAFCWARNCHLGTGHCSGLSLNRPDGTPDIFFHKPVETEKHGCPLFCGWIMDSDRAPPPE